MKNLYFYLIYSSFWYPFFVAFMLSAKVASLITDSFIIGAIIAILGCFHLGMLFIKIIEIIAEYFYSKKLFYGALFESIYVVSIPFYIFMDFYRFFSNEYFEIFFIRIPNFTHYGNFINTIIYLILYFYFVRKYTKIFIEDKKSYLKK